MANNKQLEFFGFGILGFMFGMYDEKKQEQGKLLIGKYVNEHGGVEQVYNDNFKNQPIGTTKEQIIEMLSGCERLAIEKGVIPSRKQQYGDKGQSVAFL